ncbi:MAG: hypothetical protein J6R59_01440 [Paludibacteraceae bacterium]|nr:hypothetical protein [Paludibacteraceae bacterium]
MLRRKHCSAKTQALKTSVPYGSTKVEYLESSGTQWIIPNISTKDLSVEIDYTSLKITNNNNYQKTFGYWRDNVQYQILETANYESYPNGVRATIFGQPISFGDRNNSLEIQERTKYKFDANRGEVSRNNIIYANDIDFSKGSENNPIGIFVALQNYWDNIQYDSPANMRLHSFKSWKLKLLQTHLIPSIDKTGTPCMFDLITRKNFYNVGTGQFIYPTTSATYSLRRPQAEWAKMTDTGVHKIYHTPIGYEGSLEEYAIENNYKRLVETESPNEEGKYYSFRWVETDDTLMTEWFEIDPPQEEFFEENLDNSTE